MRATFYRGQLRGYRRIIVLTLLLAVLLIPAVVSAVDGATAIYWNVIAAGGGKVQAAGKSIDYTIGQPFVGIYGGIPRDLQAGFWNAPIEWWGNYMPIMNKSAP